jgi:hypothetical protein
MPCEKAPVAPLLPIVLVQADLGPVGSHPFLFPPLVNREGVHHTMSVLRWCHHCQPGTVFPQTLDLQLTAAH